MAVSTISNASMLQIDYPPSAKDIKEGALIPYKGIQFLEPPPEWVQLWLNHQRQAENDMVQLYNAVTDVNIRATHAFTNVETSYGQLYEGTKYLYDLVEQGRQESEKELEKRLITIAKYQEVFATQLGAMIDTHTQGKESRTRAKALETRQLEGPIGFV